jgi:hypothetical protein
LITRKCFTPAFPLFLLCAIVIAAAAQDGSLSQSSPAVAEWNVKPAAVKEITVVGIIRQVPSEHTFGSPAGLHLLLSSPLGTQDASVGPYLDDDVRQALSIGQEIQIVGVIQAINGHNYLLARQLVLADRQITIRNENGFLVHPHSHAGNRPSPSRNELKGGVQ